MVGVDEARTLRDEATVGPWRWHNTGAVYLQGARTRIVMAFGRMGMSGAQPQMIREPHSRLVLDDMGRENLNDYPDARLIAAAPDLAHTVVEQWEQIERLIHDLGDQEAYDTLKARADKQAEQIAAVRAALLRGGQSVEINWRAAVEIVGVEQ